MPTPSPRRTRCNGCGDSFSIGWGLLNHQASSPCSPANRRTMAYHLPPTVPCTTINEYMEQLAEDGTLDPSFLHTYRNRGPRMVNRVVVECLRFLRCTEVGSGSSRRHAQTFLNYTKSCGGRAHILPKTVEGCWDLVEKVTFHYILVTFYYVFI